MEEFKIDPNSLRNLGSLALEKAAKGGGARRIERLAGGEKLRDEELVAVFLDREVATQTLLELSEELRATASPQIETFCPLYISNECDVRDASF